MFKSPTGPSLTSLTESHDKLVPLIGLLFNDYSIIAEELAQYGKDLHAFEKGLKKLLYLTKKISSRQEKKYHLLTQHMHACAEVLDLSACKPVDLRVFKGNNCFTLVPKKKIPELVKEQEDYILEQAKEDPIFASVLCNTPPQPLFHTPTITKAEKVEKLRQLYEAGLPLDILVYAISSPKLSIAEKALENWKANSPKENFSEQCLANLFYGRGEAFDLKGCSPQQLNEKFQCLEKKYFYRNNPDPTAKMLQVAYISGSFAVLNVIGVAIYLAYKVNADKVPDLLERFAIELARLTEGLTSFTCNPFKPVLSRDDFRRRKGKTNPNKGGKSSARKKYCGKRSRTALVSARCLSASTEEGISGASSPELITEPKRQKRVSLEVRSAACVLLDLKRNLSATVATLPSNEQTL